MTSATTIRSENVSHNPWMSILGSVISMIVNSGGVTVAAFSVFMLPLVNEFGWSRSDISLAFSISVITSAVSYPFVGWLMDRYSVKHVTLVSIVGFAASFAALSLTSSLHTFYFLFLMVGLFSPGQSVMAYAKIVSGWFDKNRGLALGIVMGSSGLSFALMPLYARYLIANYGWRGAYAGIGLAILFVGSLGVTVFVRNPPGNEEAKNLEDSTLPGLSVPEAARTYAFWAIGVAVFCLTGAFNGINAHMVPLLTTDHGITPGAAVGFLFWLGMGVMAGRLGSGIAFDYFYAPVVVAFVLAIGMLGVFILLSGAGGWELFVAVICLGFAFGGEIDAIGFLTGRYFGLKRYGVIYGWYFGAFSVASAVGPLIMGKVFDTSKSYDTALWIFIAGMVLAIGLILSLGPYRYAQRKH
jgi:MFS family permease